MLLLLLLLLLPSTCSSPTLASVCHECVCLCGCLCVCHKRTEFSSWVDSCYYVFGISIQTTNKQRLFKGRKQQGYATTQMREKGRWKMNGGSRENQTERERERERGRTSEGERAKSWTLAARTKYVGKQNKFSTQQAGMGVCGWSHAHQSKSDCNGFGETSSKGNCSMNTLSHLWASSQ
uniref:Putative secreted protein n=1 Tax=Anopheles triannulatus TaxID=58253 RepID=A0A2M4B102_9DIPT